LDSTGIAKQSNAARREKSRQTEFVALRAGNETAEANENEAAAGDCIKRFLASRSVDDSLDPRD